MPEIIRVNAYTPADQAHARRETFLGLKDRARWMEMKMIYEMWINHDQTNLGFDTFKDYMEAPKESGGLDISHSWATELVKVYQKYVLELGMTEEQILPLSPRKLYFLKDQANSTTLPDIIAKVKTMNLKALEMERKGVNETTCTHEGAEHFIHCVTCSTWIKQTHDNS